MTTAPLSNDARAIEELRSKLGGRLTIVGHHYEQEATIQHCDIRGDSLELARRVPGIASDYIVFCGVYFMAESAALLAREGQQVLLPDHSADCVMAQMTPAQLLDRVLGRLTASGRKLVPLAYVNTSLAVKAVVGRYGGAVCTSANAEKMMNWAFRQGDGVLFLPDKNLARNTARKLGITGRDTHILDVRKTGEAVDLEAADKAALVLWPGLCAIHARFHPNRLKPCARPTRPAKSSCIPNALPKWCAPPTEPAPLPTSSSMSGMRRTGHIFMSARKSIWWNASPVSRKAASAWKPCVPAPVPTWRKSRLRSCAPHWKASLPGTRIPSPCPARIPLRLRLPSNGCSKPARSF